MSVRPGTAWLEVERVHADLPTHLPRIGANSVPPVLDRSLLDRVIAVSNRDASLEDLTASGFIPQRQRRKITVRRVRRL